MTAGLPDLPPLLPPGVCSFASTIPAGGGELHELELGSVGPASESRLREFVAGRHCARQALRQLGVRDAAIPRGPDRAPVWPAGVIGSIAHCRTAAVAIAAYAGGDLRSVGIDIEEAQPIEADLALRIGAPQEHDALSALGSLAPGLAARLLFSMKEAAFKCLYPQSRQVLEFEDLRLLAVDRARCFAMARLLRPKGEVAEEVQGMFLLTSAYICCTAVLRQGQG